MPDQLRLFEVEVPRVVEPGRTIGDWPIRVVPLSREGRTVTACCGEPVMDRPFQCLHEWEAFRAAKATLEP